MVVVVPFDNENCCVAAVNAITLTLGLLYVGSCCLTLHDVLWSCLNTRSGFGSALWQLWFWLHALFVLQLCLLTNVADKRLL